MSCETLEYIVRSFLLSRETLGLLKCHPILVYLLYYVFMLNVNENISQIFTVSNKILLNP